ncbi:hypothetical protein RLEG3_02680 (plasmid) [Rhizobium leguminosarum bv. trifolii WSM1689]|nr:hypothetical protein RLEG3_02680 [Rhizobium leguminosarum bv. trifolii WSM1689]
MALSDFDLPFSHLRDISSLMQIKKCPNAMAWESDLPEKGTGHALDRGRGLQELPRRGTVATSSTS